MNARWREREGGAGLLSVSIRMIRCGDVVVFDVMFDVMLVQAHHA